MNQNYLAGLLGISILGLLALFPILGTIFIILLIIISIYTWWQKADFSRSLFYIPDQGGISEVYADQQKLHIFLSEKSKYMRSDEWKNKRQFLIRTRKLCESCGSPSNLRIHHLRDYSLIPNESYSSLAVLCNICHKMQHIYYGFPKTYEDYMNWDAPLINEA